MLTQVDIQNSRGVTLPLPFADFGGGFLVKDITGLDPVKATLSSSRVAQLDGSEFQNARGEDRNILLTLGVEPDYAIQTVADLRRELYKYLMPKAPVTIKFYEDGQYFAHIDGRVESFEAPRFSQEVEITVSIMCHKPDFLGVDMVQVSGNTVADNTEMQIDYEGNADAGFLYTLFVNRPISEFTIYNRIPGGQLQSFEFVGSLLAGDVLRISSVPGNKYVRLTRAGSESSVLYGMNPASSWIVLSQEDNYFRTLVTGAPIPYTIDYRARYGGL